MNNPSTADCPPGMATLAGSILDIPTGIICHQVNCRHVAGAGLALQIGKRWPQWYAHYRSAPAILGAIGTFRIQAAPPLWIASLYSQREYGTVRRQTDYAAFRKCLQHLLRFAHSLETQALPIYLPYKIGCGLAGGDWSVISLIITEEVPQARIVVPFIPLPKRN